MKITFTSKKDSESNVATTSNSDKITGANNGKDTFSNQNQSRSKGMIQI